MNKKNIIKILILILVFTISFSVTYGVRTLVLNGDSVDEGVIYSNNFNTAVIDDNEVLIDESNDEKIIIYKLNS